MRRSCVIGLGNPDRGDDGLGHAALRLLAGTVAADITLLQRNAAGPGLLDDWRDFDKVILVDAAAGPNPGQIHRLEATSPGLPMPLAPGSTHGLGLAETLALAKALGRLPPQLVIYAMEGADYSFGAALSPAVAAAMPRLAVRLRAQLRVQSPVPAGT